MTLDAAYLRGSLAGVLSMLRHSACPESTVFDFLATCPGRFQSALAASFPSLSFAVYRFDPALVRGRIFSSVRSALDRPLNHARIYLVDILPRSVRRVIYFDLTSSSSTTSAACGPPTSLQTTSSRPPSTATPTSPLLHRAVLVRSGVPRRPHRPPTPALLLQHRGHGHGPQPVAHEGLHPEARSLDGGAEAKGADLRARLAAAVPAGVRGRGQEGGAPMEPARSGRRQRRGAVPGPPPGPGEPASLEWQGQAVAPPRRRSPLPHRRALGPLRPPPPRVPRRPLRQQL
uniref:Uncharacterized protein n=2 Tax=Musa acuminata subsp. malaccensis TaxID=214687 RepID=A0A804IWJ4_MUSAM